MRSIITIPFLLTAVLALSSRGEVTILDIDNIQEVLNENTFAFIFFYKEWEGHTTTMWPIFENVSQHFQNSTLLIEFASLNCSFEAPASEYCTNHRVTEYPTLKLFMYGREEDTYDLRSDVSSVRNPITVEALTDYVLEKADYVVYKYRNAEELRRQLDPTRNHVIGAFKHAKGRTYENFWNVSYTLRGTCDFHIGYVNNSQSISFLRAHSNELELYTSQHRISLAHTERWLTVRCKGLQVTETKEDEPRPTSAKYAAAGERKQDECKREKEVVERRSENSIKDNEAQQEIKRLKAELAQARAEIEQEKRKGLLLKERCEMGLKVLHPEDVEGSGV